MLQKLRDKTSGWIATVILTVVTVPFAFFGMEQYLVQRNETFAARVQAPPQWWSSAPAWWPVSALWQKEDIEADEFRTAFERQRQQQRQQQGDQFDARAFESVDSKRKILDALIDQRVLRMAAGRAGVAVGDAQVRKVIQSDPSFQNNGRFDPQRYQLLLGSQVPALSPRQYQEQVRQNMQQRLIPVEVAASAFATDAETDRVWRLWKEKRDVGFAIMPPPAPDTSAVSAMEIQRWYDSHRADYRAPETVSIEYVDVDGNALAAPPAADEASLRQRYEQEKARFVQPEQRQASHILVKVDANASPAVQKAAEAKARQLAEQARQPGADFAALARANSDDTGSKAAGGDLGWVAKGVMVKPFEDALFSMRPGEVRGPVKSEFGWHVLQLRDVKAGAQVPFEQVRDQLAQEQTQADREHAFNDLTSKLVDAVLKNPTTLAPAAREAGLPVQTAGPFARGQGSGIAANPAVQRNAFSESLIQDGTISDPIEIGPNHSVLIRVAQHGEAHELPLEQVAPRVIAAIRGDRAAKAAVATADRLVAELRGGKPLAEVTAAHQLASSEIPGLPRGAPVPDAAANEAMFATSAAPGGKVSAGKAVLPDGRIVVFVVNKVIPGDPKQAKPEERAALRQQLAQAEGVGDGEALIRALRQRMKITVAEDRL